MYSEDWNKIEPWEVLMDRLRQEISLSQTAWTDYNLHDPGITILELFVGLSQMQKYHAGRIGELHLKKYARILGIQPIKKTSGRTLVTVRSHTQQLLRAGTKFFAGRICFETKEDQMVAENMFLAFETESDGVCDRLEGHWLAQGMGVSIVPFGKKPKQKANFTIELAQPLTSQVLHRLYLEIGHGLPVKRRLVNEEAFDGHGFYPLAQIRMEFWAENEWKQAQIVGDETYGMIQDGTICFRISSPMGEEDPRIRFVLERSDYLVYPQITRISMEMIEVWQQETRTDFARWNGTGFPNQRYELEKPDLMPESLMLSVAEESELSTKNYWSLVTDFDRSGPEDTHYLLEGGHLIFGDGFRGRMPEGNIQIERVIFTLGAGGNIKAGAITRCGQDETITVINEWDVTGGTDDEVPVETANRFREGGVGRQRAVTYKDYEELVMEIPGLLIQDCRVYGGCLKQREVIIAVKPYQEDGYGVLNQAYEKNLYRYLEEKRLIGTKLLLVSPEYYELEIICVASAKIQYRDAKSQIEAAIADFIESKRFGEGLCYEELKGFIGTMSCLRRLESLWLNTGTKGKRNRLGDLLIPPNGILKLKRVVCSLTESGGEGNG